MMAEVELKAGQLSRVTQAFEALQGPKPIQLSYTIGKILTEADTAHNIMLEKLQPFIAEDGTVATDNEEAMAVLSEPVTLYVPALSVADLQAADLKVTDDIAFAFLTLTGIVSCD